MASSTDGREGEDYKTYFDGKTYASPLFEMVEDTEFSKITRFKLDTLHKIYSSGKLLKGQQGRRGRYRMIVGHKLPVHVPVPITTNVVRSNPTQARCTRYNIM